MFGAGSHSQDKNNADITSLSLHHKVLPWVGMLIFKNDEALNENNTGLLTDANDAVPHKRAVSKSFKLKQRI